jgi:energy-coupling factor transporter ATP-binding protein EcfA2
VYNIGERDIIIVKTDVEFLEHDWETWKRLEDAEKQYEILRENTQKLGRGLLETRFEEYILREAPRYLVQTEQNIKLFEERKVDIIWRKLRPADKATIITSFLEQLHVINPIAVSGSEKEYSIIFGYNNILLDFETWGKDALTLLFGRFISIATLREVERVMRAKARIISRERVNPPSMLRLKTAILDLEDLSIHRLENIDEYYFSYYMPVFTDILSLDTLKTHIDEIKNGNYDITTNKVYRLFRKRFSDEDWEYLTSALGVILSPYNAKLLVFLIGETGAGKSTFLNIITKPIRPLVANISLSNITRYTFGLEPLLGKQILVTHERGEVFLHRIDILNLVFGEQDTIEIPRKHKPHAQLKSLKLGIISMNDPPIIAEYGGETMRAFFERLSIVTMTKPEEEENIKGIANTVSPEEAFDFLLWCRIQLEKNNFQIKKMPAEKIMETFRQATNPVLKFLSEETSILEQAPDKRIKGKELYDIYVKWCTMKNITPMPINKFYMTVATQFEKYERDKTIWFRGIGKKTEENSVLREVEKYSE